MLARRELDFHFPRCARFRSFSGRRHVKAAHRPEQNSRGAAWRPFRFWTGTMIHLIKLCVGVDRSRSSKTWRAERQGAGARTAGRAQSSPHPHDAEARRRDRRAGVALLGHRRRNPRPPENRRVRIDGIRDDGTPRLSHPHGARRHPHRSAAARAPSRAGDTSSPKTRRPISTRSAMTATRALSPNWRGSGCCEPRGVATSAFRLC